MKRLPLAALPRRLMVFAYGLGGFRFDATDVRNAWWNSRGDYTLSDALSLWADDWRQRFGPVW